MMLRTLIFIIIFGFSENTSHNSVKTSDKITEKSSVIVSKQGIYNYSDSTTLPIDDLTMIYTQAIAEFIHAGSHQNKRTFDTLYFGKHQYGQEDDFPDIKLPMEIEKTQIRLIDPIDFKTDLIITKSNVYVNMMGWADKEKAEFIFVVFGKGAEHQYDYFIDFIYNASIKKFELFKIESENYSNIKGQKPKRTIVFKDSQYILQR